jgi:fatty acid desaturase
MYKVATWCIYALPLVPLAVSLSLVVINRRVINQRYKSAKTDRSETRTMALSVGALSFGGLVGVAALAGPGSPYVLPAVYFLAISFVMFFVGVALQSYKFTHLEDVLSDGLQCSGEMGLMVAVGALLLRASAGGWRGWTLAALAVGVATFDSGRRLRLQSRYLRGVRDAQTVEPAR